MYVGTVSFYAGQNAWASFITRKADSRVNTMYTHIVRPRVALAV